VDSSADYSGTEPGPRRAAARHCVGAQPSPADKSSSRRHRWPSRRVDIERLSSYVYAMDIRLAITHEQAILATLGPPGRMLSGSKTGYYAEHPDHLPVFNANVCLGSSKVWHGDLDLTLDEEALLDLASQTEQIVSVLYETDGRFKHEDHPLIAEAVYSAAPSGHSLVDSVMAERRPDGRLYTRVRRRPPHWRRPARPRLWRFWKLNTEREQTANRNGTQTSRYLRIGGRSTTHQAPLLVLSVHTWSREARGAWVECTWHSSGHRAWAPPISGRAKWHRGGLRPYVGWRVAPGLAHDVCAGVIVGPTDFIWG
jgi:hypothetical protein